MSLCYPLEEEVRLECTYHQNRLIMGSMFGLSFILVTHAFYVPRYTVGKVLVEQNDSKQNKLFKTSPQLFQKSGINVTDDNFFIDVDHVAMELLERM